MIITKNCGIVIWLHHYPYCRNTYMTNGTSIMCELYGVMFNMECDQTFTVERVDCLLLVHDSLQCLRTMSLRSWSKTIRR